MKRAITVLLVLGLLVGTLSSTGAAGKAKPSKHTFYLHGTETVGEIDLANNFAVAYNQMDRNEPSGSAPKSRPFTTWRGDPQMWNDCAGSYLLPVWSGPVSGRIVGDIKVTLHTVSAPRSVTVQVWPDLMTQTCASNDLGDGSYPMPAAEATVELPAGPGETTFVLKKVNFKAVAGLTMQILPQGPVPGRVLFDSADYPSRIEFTCIGNGGKPCA